MSASASQSTAWNVPPPRSGGYDAGIRIRPAVVPSIVRLRHNQLARTIAEEVVPRLLLTQREAVVVTAEQSAESVKQLVALVLQPDFHLDCAKVDDLNNQASGAEAMFLDLLTPAALRLGEMWEDDAADFVQVTIGVARLHQILTRHSVPLDQQADLVRAPRILLAPAPGDQHTFGLAMVTSFFQRAGWAGWSGTPVSVSDLVGRVQHQAYAIVGFSVANEKNLDRLTSAIRDVRRASCNRDVGIMVGGPIFTAHPELVAMVGADTSAIDGRGAVQQARRLLSLKPPHR